MRAALIVIGIVEVWSIEAHAQARDVRAERQTTLNELLEIRSREFIARDRVACLSGSAAKSIATVKGAGLAAQPDLADHCVTILIRSARDGATTPLQVAGAREPSSASAFDNGFMQGYVRREPPPAGLPTMATLKPAAERCLSLQEMDIQLCAAVGSAYGRRAASGELVIVR